MVELTKLNEELIMVNPSQIEFIESIPESKIIMMNGRYHIVKESTEEIREKITVFFYECNNGKKEWRM